VFEERDSGAHNRTENTEIAEKMKLGLLIWKNGLIRLRHPVRTIFEIIWPLLIFVILIRDSNTDEI